MKLIKNAKILTMTDNSVIEGAIIFDDKIRYIGNDFKNFHIDEEIDAFGAYVMPGMIDAHCHVGIVEDSLGFEGDDTNDESEPVTPHLRAIDAINPFDRCFVDAASAGITCVVTGPGSANPISGQFAAVKTSGVCIDDMIIKAPCALKLALGENPKSVFADKEEAPLTRMGTMALLREMFIKAKDYKKQYDEYRENPEENDKPDFDMKSHSLMDVLCRKIPVKIHAHRADDICSAIRLGKEFDLDITIEHCSDGDAVAQILEREKVPVMLGPTLSDRSKPELSNLSFETYKNLSDRGIDVAIITDHPEITIENLTLCAAMAVRNGMDETKAMQAITSISAKNCRIDDKVGTLEIGKDADIAVFSDLPVKFDAKCKMTFVNGERVKG